MAEYTDSSGGSVDLLIESSHLFKSLDEDGRKQILASGELVRFDAGTVILFEGEEGDAFYLLKKGSVWVSTRRGGKDVRLATLARGAFFGEVAVLSGQPRTATVTAAEPVEAVRFDKEKIDEILVHYPRVRKLLEAVVLGRAKDTIEKLTRSS
jgi:CRP-like cAMP-binding protein